MVLKQTVKVQETRTNVTVNIPVKLREMAGISGGDTVILSADSDNQTITIKKA